jgi:hypothetical protein
MRRHCGSLAFLAAALLLPLGATAAEDTDKPAAAAKAARDERQCSMPTSPRLQKKNDDCSQAKEWARSHSGADLSSTGQFNAAEALRRLDPRLY